MRRATMAVVDMLSPMATAKMRLSNDSVKPTVATASAPRRPTKKTSTTANKRLEDHLEHHGDGQQQDRAIEIA